MKRKANVYALFVELAGRRLYFYVGASESRLDRMWDHGIKRTGAKTPLKFIRIMRYAGLEIQRTLLAIYDPTTVWEWEQYWWDSLVRRGHPIQNERPMDASKARLIRWTGPQANENRRLLSLKMKKLADPAKARRAATSEQRRAWGLMGGRLPGGNYRSESCVNY